MKIKTIFSVKTFDKTGIYTETYQVKGHSQEAAQTIQNKFANEPNLPVIKLKGFMINDEFFEADLTSHWERTKLNGNLK